MIKYLKKEHYWQKIFFIVGTPRSGKTTLLNIFNSCSNIEAVDEPVDLIGLAQTYSDLNVKNSMIKRQIEELFWMNADHLFSESVVGRNYNFRKKDISYIGNVKNKSQIKSAFKIRNKIETIQKIRSDRKSFAVSLNDCEKSLKMFDNNSSSIIRIKSNILDVAKNMEIKNWFSDKQLSNDTNLLPGYKEIIKFKNKKFFIPYNIPKKDHQLFIKSNKYERGLLYYSYQENNLDNANDVKMTSIQYYDLFDQKLIDKLFKKFNLKSTSKTKRILKAIKERKRETILAKKISFDVYNRLSYLLKKNHNYEAIKRLF